MTRGTILRFLGAGLVALLISTAAQAAAISDSIAGYWTFDSYTETGANPTGTPQGGHEGYFEDSSGNAQTAYSAVVGSGDYVPMDAGKFGNAVYSVNPAGDSGLGMATVVKNTSAISINQESFTYSFWSKAKYRAFDSSNNWAPGEGRSLFFAQAPTVVSGEETKGVGVYFFRNSLSVVTNADNFVQSTLASKTYSQTNPATEAADSGQWANYVLTGTYESGTNDYALVLYLNGEMVAQTSSNVSNDIISNDGDLNIGAFHLDNDTYASQRSLSWHLSTDPSTIAGEGWMDDLALLKTAFTAGEAAATANLGNHADLGYTMAEVAQLLDVFEAGSGDVTVGDLKWAYASGLAGADGELTGAGSDFTLVLDGSAGTGLVSTAVPEPATLGLLVVGAGAILRRRRR